MALKTIMLVDDSETALMFEQVLLDGRCYRLITARDGQEAITRALAEHPDLIVMDVLMPRLDGFRACQELRNREETKAIPVIMVTALGQLVDMETGFESGCTEYVTKPINGLELLSKIESCLGECEVPDA